LKIEPVTLTGQLVRLEPISETHIADLALVATNESIWSYFASGALTNETQLKEFVLDLRKKQAQGTDLPFAVIYRETGKAIGCTRFMEIRKEHRGLEIGGTWYGVAYQRTGVNTECKYLLLKHAFEVLGCIRVQLKTDLRNVRSQRAIERIGAVREGVLRHQMIMPDGYFRDSVYYSFTNDDWPRVKAHLEKLLGSYEQKLSTQVINYAARLTLTPLQTREELELCARLYSNSEPWIMLKRDYKHAIQTLSDKTSEVYVAKAENEIVGFIILSMQGAFVGYIQTLCIASSWRSKGLGSHILKWAEERIFRNSPNVFMCVSSFNQDAQRLYQRLGYEVVGEFRDYIIQGHSEILLRKTKGPLSDSQQFKKD